MKFRIQRKWSKATLQAFKMLQSQDFEDFYKGEMDTFIVGEEAAKSPDEICSMIAEMMGEPQAPKVTKENRILELAGLLQEDEINDIDKKVEKIMQLAQKIFDVEDEDKLQEFSNKLYRLIK